VNAAFVFADACGRGAHVDTATNVVRLANVYGPGDRDRVLPLFLEAALSNRPLILYGGQQVIDVQINPAVPTNWDPLRAETASRSGGSARMRLWPGVSCFEA